MLARVHRLGTCVTRLIDSKLASARQRELCKQTPANIAHLCAIDIVLTHLAHERLDILAHQVQLVLVILVGRMHGDLSGEQAEDQPAMTDVHVRQTEQVAQECAVGFGLLATDDDVSSVDHQDLSVSGRLSRTI